MLSSHIFDNFCYRIYIIGITRRTQKNLTQSDDKSPQTNTNVKKAKWQHKRATKKFDYTAIANRLKTVTWNNYSNPTRMVNRLSGPLGNLLTPRNNCVIKTH